MDFFNKGVIGEANINRWMPESALYFLGNVFLKIRRERRTIDEDEFIIECERVYKKSNKDDIDYFIREVEEFQDNRKTLSHNPAKQEYSFEDRDRHD